MDLIKIGKLVNTHGIKGEVKILSDFTKKDLIFKPGFSLYVGREKEKLEIDSYRHHQIFDMVTIVGITNINEVLKYKGADVYINKEDLILNEDDYLLEDLIDMCVIFNQETIGTVTEFINNNGNILLCVKGEKSFYIPIKGNFIEKVDIPNNNIVVKNIEGLII